ncbi:MAG: aryl-sulfate sulfotransferase [Myxococcota bacterium]
MAGLVLAMLVGCGDDLGPAAPGSSTDASAPSSSTTDASSSPAATGTGGSISTSGDTGASSDTSSGSSPTTTGDDENSGSSTGEPTVADPRGYTLFAPLASRFTYLMDADGLEINRWESETLPANSAYMLPNGHMLRVSRAPESTVDLVSGVGGIVQEYDWQGNLVWQYDHVGPSIIAHHDIEWMPNGHVLIIAYEMFTFEQAVAAGRDPATVSPDGLWADTLVEVDPTTDTIVWEWHVWDHLVQDYDPMADHYGAIGDHPERIDINWLRPGTSARPDWTHINAVAYDESLDQIVLSPRTFSEIWIIDHSTTTAQAASSTGGNAGRGGDLLYRWGNPATYDAGDTLDRQLYFQHNPRWIPADKPGGGHLLVFDNGDDVLRPWSRVIEIETPVQPDGTYPLRGASFDPLDPAWVYEDPPNFYAAFISGADRLADGRTLICNGPAGSLFEVTDTGQIQWSFTVGSSTFRAERYEADHPAWHGLSKADLMPGDPVMVNLDR